MLCVVCVACKSCFIMIHCPIAICDRLRFHFTWTMCMRLSVDAKETECRKICYFHVMKIVTTEIGVVAGEPLYDFFQCQTPRVVRLLLTIDWQKTSSVFSSLGIEWARKFIFNGIPSGKLFFCHGYSAIAHSKWSKWSVNAKARKILISFFQQKSCDVRIHSDVVKNDIVLWAWAMGEYEIVSVNRTRTQNLRL